MASTDGGDPMTTVRVAIPGQSYDVLVSPHARFELTKLIRNLSDVGRVLVIADERVAGLHGAALQDGLPSNSIFLTVPQGEASKSLDTAGPHSDCGN